MRRAPQLRKAIHYSPTFPNWETGNPGWGGLNNRPNDFQNINALSSILTTAKLSWKQGFNCYIICIMLSRNSIPRLGKTNSQIGTSGYCIPRLGQISRQFPNWDGQQVESRIGTMFHVNPKLGKNAR